MTDMMYTRHLHAFLCARPRYAHATDSAAWLAGRRITYGSGAQEAAGDPLAAGLLQ